MAKPDPQSETGLRQTSWKRFLRAPDAQLLEELYVPALGQAVGYDRCCAYFSSRVLAIAARGFGGFIQNLLTGGDTLPQPAARLLVNEQLDPRDLEALLSTGDPQALIEKLLQEFQTPQDALEKNRLEMLAWLVASGWLEIRVGLMRHTRGVSHAKFGVVIDRQGDSLAFMGSDNETGAALVENYEELEVRTSWQDQEFTDYYRDRFEMLWTNQDENVTTVPLPEAVRQKLIKMAPLEPPEERHQDKPALSAALLWHFLAAAPYLPQGEYACDATALVDVWPHQRRVIEDTASAFPAGRLLCDEVGLGKTIEAILILRRLLCGRGVQRALLLVPAGLLSQWQDELREKGGLLIPRWESGYLHQPDGQRQSMEAPAALAENPVLLVSREWARLESHSQEVLTAPPWDLVLVDEAHAARRSAPAEREFNSANLLLQLLCEMQLRRRTRGILLLSATPMQTQPWEPWDLLAVLGVGGDWIVEFQDLREYYQGVEDLRGGALDLLTAAHMAHLVTRDHEFPEPDCLPGTNAKSVAQGLVFARGRERDEYAEMLRQGAPLGRRMHRNTRDTLRQYHHQGLLDRPPADRQVKDEVFDYQAEAERACYDAIEDYIDERYDRLEQEKAGKGFVMTIYRRRAASSPRSLRRSLERRLEGLEQVIHRKWRDEWWLDEVQVDLRDLVDADLEERIDPALPTDPEIAEAEKETIQSLLRQLDDLGATDSKLSHFWAVLQEVTGDGRSVLVFTEYADTMEYLRAQLRPTYGATLGCYSGAGGQVWNGQDWEPVSKAAITERLMSGELQVLLCTDAASEGLNLQAASALINYDLPWNPSKVEQRIGRIDRIGQQQSLLPIRNLFLTDSVDMRVYQVLRERCGLFVHFVGPMQPVLARAREALRTNPKREETGVVVAQLIEVAEEVDADAALIHAFVETEAIPVPRTEPSVSRADIEIALTWLEEAPGQVQAERVEGSSCWQLRGVDPQPITVTMDREILEDDPEVVPLTLMGGVLPQLVERLELPSHLPLVLGEYAAGPFRSVEARWVLPDGVVEVTSARQLAELIQAWEGKPSPPVQWVQAQGEARNAAQKRVEAMERAAQAAEEANLRRQLEAARHRLLRELGRTLRCLGDGNLDRLFREQVKREKRTDGRYHQALKLLQGYPPWTSEEVANAKAFVADMTPQQRQGRVALGSEVDAALNDPRWRAMGN